MEPHSSLLSVAICTWNRAQVLQRTLASMEGLKVPHGVSWELLLVNNNCSDSTDEVCRSFFERLPIRLLHERTPGLSYARNHALATARGSHILWTDDDVLVDPLWLEQHWTALQQTSADLVFGMSKPEWPDGQPGWYSDRFAGLFALLDYGPEAFTVTTLDKPFFGLNFGGTLEAHRVLGGFRTEFGVRGNGGGVGEDTDLFERAIQQGMSVRYVPQAKVRHIIPPERTTKTYHRRRQAATLRVYYQHLHEIFPEAPRIFGIPRFFYGKAASDAAQYLRARVRGNAGDQFYYELQLSRFVGLLKEAARAVAD